MKKLTKRGECLVLKVVGPNGESHNGFIWPLEVGAVVDAPDWRPTVACGNGLHGWHYGAGKSDVAGSRVDAADSRWLLLVVDESTVIDLDGKVKFPRCRLAFVAAEDPHRAASVRAMEAALSATARVKAVQAGCDPREQRHERTFFGPGEKGRGWGSYGIDAHLRWATTDGKRAKAVNLEAAAADARQRWGIE